MELDTKFLAKMSTITSLGKDSRKHSYKDKRNISVSVRPSTTFERIAKSTSKEQGEVEEPKLSSGTDVHIN